MGQTEQNGTVKFAFYLKFKMFWNVLKAFSLNFSMLFTNGAGGCGWESGNVTSSFQHFHFEILQYFLVPFHFHQKIPLLADFHWDVSTSYIRLTTDSSPVSFPPSTHPITFYSIFIFISFFLTSESILQLSLDFLSLYI